MFFTQRSTGALNMILYIRSGHGWYLLTSHFTRIYINFVNCSVPAAAAAAGMLFLCNDDVLSIKETAGSGQLL